MNERVWELLITRIEDEKCTPFLGAGINYGVLPLGGEIAREWAERYHYPLKDSDDLPRVAQYIAVEYKSPDFPKSEVLRRLRRAPAPDFYSANPNLEGLAAMAELPLPVYMTTNYDNLMVKALQHQKKEPRRELCRWNTFLRKYPSAFDSREGYDPSVASPVVFHLHGHDEVEKSLVLTEDDYLDFLVNISRNQKLLPPRIQQAMADSSLLFIGYSLRDINFRVLYRGLVQSLEGSLRSRSVAVQLPPDDHGGDPKAAQEYLTKYFERLEVEIYWGTATQFAKELGDRWRKFRGNG